MGFLLFTYLQGDWNAGLSTDSDRFRLVDTSHIKLYVYSTTRKNNLEVFASCGKISSGMSNSRWGPVIHHFTRMAFIAALFSGCVHSTRSENTSLNESATNSDGIYELRRNPCSCIVNRPELDFEVKFGNSWKRILLLTDAQPLDAQLLDAFKSEPRKVIRVKAEFKDIQFEWLTGHQARGAKVVLLTESSTSGP